jgi:hypothetical protein
MFHTPSKVADLPRGIFLMGHSKWKMKSWGSGVAEGFWRGLWLAFPPMLPVIAFN